MYTVCQRLPNAQLNTPPDAAVIRVCDCVIGEAAGRLERTGGDECWTAGLARGGVVVVGQRSVTGKT